jgi:hypothetical protein
MSTEHQSDEDENPYASPAAPQSSGQLESSRVQDPETRELRAFVGSKADSYLSNWASMRRRSGSSGFNLAAFFLSGLWLPYRKMYKATGIFFGVIIVESILEQVVFVDFLNKPEVPRALANIVGLVVAVVCGAYGNRWYLSHAKKIIAEVRLQGLDDESFLKELARRGGTSLLASLGVVFLFIVSTVGLVAIAILGSQE